MLGDLSSYGFLASFDVAWPSSVGLVDAVCRLLLLLMPLHSSHCTALLSLALWALQRALHPSRGTGTRQGRRPSAALAVSGPSGGPGGPVPRPAGAASKPPARRAQVHVLEFVSCAGLRTRSFKRFWPKHGIDMGA